MDADGGLAAFRYYGFEPSNKAQKINPFREERTSSFYIIRKYGKIIFKDFGDDSIKGDARKFVQLYERLDAKQTFQRLCEIYNLAEISLPIKKLNQRPKDNSKKTPEKFRKELIDIKFRDFSKEELEFWLKKGNINQETLKANGVKSVLSFAVSVAPEKVKKFTNLSFVFAFEIVKNKAYKLYMPRPEKRAYAPSKTVFLPGLAPARETLGDDYTYSFGIESLEAGKASILCAGEADCLALKSAGYNAFTLGDERASLPPFVLRQLNEKLFPEKKKTAGELIRSVIYDNDLTGLKASYDLSKKYHIPQLILPKLGRQFRKTDPKPLENDICDYYGKFGLDADFQILLHKQNFQNSDFEIPSVPQIPVNKYLSEKKEILAAFIRENKRIQIDADAGVGKTYTMLVEMPKMLKRPLLFVVPFAIQVEQIEKEYEKLTEELVCFSNSGTKYSSKDEFSLLHQKAGKVNVCTYDRIQTVFQRLNTDYGEELMVVVDESHLLTSEYAYRTRAIHDVLEVCASASKVVYLSATPDYSLCKFSSFRLISFKRNDNPIIRISAMDYTGEPKKNLLALLLNQLEESKALTSNPSTKKAGINIIRLNNKTLAKVIAQVLIEKGFYRKEEIDFVFSEKRKGSSSEAKDSIIAYSYIPDKIRLLFVTSCFDCGINILNENIHRITSFETRYTDNCKDTVKQFIARFRNLKRIDLMICKPEKLKAYAPIKSKQQLYERLVKDAENKLALLPYNDPLFCQKMTQHLTDIQNFGLNTPHTPRYIKANHDISAIHKLLSRHKTKGNYQINYNYIRFMLKEYERKNLNSTDFYTNLVNELPECQLIARTSFIPKTSDVNQTLKGIIEGEKELKKERIIQVCHTMETHTRAFFDAVHASYQDLALKEQIKRVFAVSPVSNAPCLETLLNERENGLTQNTEINVIDDEIVELSHRYFYLKDLLIPAEKIPKLLQKHSNDVSFGILTKKLVNQISLLAKRKTGREAGSLITDARKLEDVQWLEVLTDAVKELKNKTYVQQKSLPLKRKLQSAEYDLKILKYEKVNLLASGLDHLIKLKQGEKLKTRLRQVKRKLRSLNSFILKQEKFIENLKKKYESSCIKGFEVNELSEWMNKFRPHAADRKGVVANIRLLSSLFELKTTKRLVICLDEQGKSEAKEKYFVEIRKELTFNEILQKSGFNETEADEYLHHLNYQIELDLQSNQDFFSKFETNSIQSANNRHRIDVVPIEKKPF